MATITWRTAVLALMTLPLGVIASQDFSVAAPILDNVRGILAAALIIAVPLPPLPHQESSANLDDKMIFGGAAGTQ